MYIKRQLPIILRLYVLLLIAVIGVTNILILVHQQTTSAEVIDKGLLTEKEAAIYLSMSPSEFSRLIERQQILKEEAAGIAHNPYAFLPWLNENHKKYFAKTQLEKWIEFNTTNQEPIFKE